MCDNVWLTCKTWSRSNSMCQRGAHSLNQPGPMSICAYVCARELVHTCVLVCGRACLYDVLMRPSVRVCERRSYGQVILMETLYLDKGPCQGHDQLQISDVLLVHIG